MLLTSQEWTQSTKLGVRLDLFDYKDGRCKRSLFYFRVSPFNKTVPVGRFLTTSSWT